MTSEELMVGILADHGMKGGHFKPTEECMCAC